MSFWEASMLGHGAGIGYKGLSPRIGPTDNFSLVTGLPSDLQERNDTPYIPTVGQ